MVLDKCTQDIKTKSIRRAHVVILFEYIDLVHVIEDRAS